MAKYVADRSKQTLFVDGSPGILLPESSVCRSKPLSPAQQARGVVSTTGIDIKLGDIAVNSHPSAQGLTGTLNSFGDSLRTSATHEMREGGNRQCV